MVQAIRQYLDAYEESGKMGKLENRLNKHLKAIGMPPFTGKISEIAAGERKFEPTPDGTEMTHWDKVTAAVSGKDVNEHTPIVAKWAEEAQHELGRIDKARVPTRTEWFGAPLAARVKVIEVIHGAMLADDQNNLKRAIALGAMLVVISKQRNRLNGPNEALKTWVPKTFRFTYMQSRKFIRVAMHAKKLSRDPAKLKAFMALGLMEAYEQAGMSAGIRDTSWVKKSLPAFSNGRDGYEAELDPKKWKTQLRAMMMDKGTASKLREGVFLKLADGDDQPPAAFKPKK